MQGYSLLKREKELQDKLKSCERLRDAWRIVANGWRDHFLKTKDILTTTRVINHRLRQDIDFAISELEFVADELRGSGMEYLLEDVENTLKELNDEN